MKVILPVAGKGVRLQPYTNDLPKCLLPVGGKTIIDWIVEDTLKLNPSETIFIAGYKAEKFQEFLQKKDWGKTRMVLQENPQGLGEAISLALPHVNDDEPLLIVLGDTLFDADLGVLAGLQGKDDPTTNILYTYKVQDPSRFGVVETDESGRITRLVEKPQEFISDEAIVGIYYIKDVKALRDALNHIMGNDIRVKGEFQLTNALEIMLKQGCEFRTAPVKEWLDCGLPETLLKTNAWLLENRSPTPCHIGKGSTLESCTLGPNVCIGDNCQLKNVSLSNCIVWDDVTVENQKYFNEIIVK